LSEYKRISAQLEQMLKTAEFKQGNKKINFAKLEKIYIAKVRKLEKEYPVKSLEFQVYFWAKILEDLQDLNLQLLQDMRDYLQDENTQFHRFLLQDYLGVNYPTLRVCLCQELKRKGFYAPPDKTDLGVLLQYFQAQYKI